MRRKGGDLQGLGVGGEAVAVFIPPGAPPLAVVFYVVGNAGEFAEAEVADVVMGLPDWSASRRAIMLGMARGEPSSARAVAMV
jgi:hypothetical protein